MTPRLIIALHLCTYLVVTVFLVITFALFQEAWSSQMVMVMGLSYVLATLNAWGIVGLAHLAVRWFG